MLKYCMWGTFGLKSCIDDGDPAIIFVSACSIYESYIYTDNYYQEDIEFFEGHAMYTYGYTKSKLCIVDEYMCIAGWWNNTSYYTCGLSFVSKSAIRGNVKILY